MITNDLLQQFGLDLLNGKLRDLVGGGQFVAQALRSDQGLGQLPEHKVKYKQNRNKSRIKFSMKFNFAKYEYVDKLSEDEFK